MDPTGTRDQPGNLDGSDLPGSARRPPGCRDRRRRSRPRCEAVPTRVGVARQCLAEFGVEDRPAVTTCTSASAHGSRTPLGRAAPRAAPVCPCGPGHPHRLDDPPSGRTPSAVRAAGALPCTVRRSAAPMRPAGPPGRGRWPPPDGPCGGEMGGRLIERPAGQCVPMPVRQSASRRDGRAGERPGGSTARLSAGLASS